MERVRWYVATVCLLAIVAGAALYAAAPSYETRHSAAVLWLALLGVAALLQVHKLPHGGSGSIAFIPFLACAVVAPSWLAVAATAAANLIAEIFNRRGPLKATFNVAQTCLAMSLAVLTYLSLGGVSLLGHSEDSLLRSGNVAAIPFIVLVAVFSQLIRFL